MMIRQACSEAESWVTWWKFFVLKQLKDPTKLEMEIRSAAAD